MKIDSSGNVGIGWTAAPTSRVYINNEDDAANRPVLTLRQADPGSTYIAHFAGASDMVIQRDGKVGIGTASPARLLTLDAAAAPALGFYTAGTERAKISADTSNNLIFDTGNSEKMRIASAGNFTHSATGSVGGDYYSSQVNGPYFRFYRNSSTIQAYMGSGVDIFGGGASAGDFGLYPTNGNLILGAAGFIRMQGNTNPWSDGVYSLGSSAQRWADVWAVNGVIQTSDLRDKVREGDAPGLAFVNQLKPMAYRWKKDDGLLHYGLGAQDVRAIAAKGAFVTGSEDTRYGINYSEFIAPLIKSVQELSAENAVLRAENAAQDARLDALEARLAE